MTMFTAQEESDLSKLLASTENEEDVLTIRALHGFLFGLAIIPDLVENSEWLPHLFDEDILHQHEESEEKSLLGSLFVAYNRLVHQNQDGVLSFPFGDSIESEDIQLVREWTNGFFRAISLRPSVFGMTDGEEEVDVDDLDEEDMELARCSAIIAGFTYPDEIPDIFADRDGSILNTIPGDLSANLIAMLPAAVNKLKNYANEVRDCLVRLGADSPMIPRVRL